MPERAVAERKASKEAGFLFAERKPRNARLDIRHAERKVSTAADCAWSMLFIAYYGESSRLAPMRTDELTGVRTLVKTMALTPGKDIALHVVGMSICAAGVIGIALLKG